MKIPGYVTVYKNIEDGFVHLYFYPGYDDGKQIIRLKLSDKLNDYDWNFTKNPDKSIDYKFQDKNIKEIEYSIINIASNLRKSYKWLSEE